MSSIEKEMLYYLTKELCDSEKEFGLTAFSINMFLEKNDVKFYVEKGQLKTDLKKEDYFTNEELYGELDDFIKWFKTIKKQILEMNRIMFKYAKDMELPQGLIESFQENYKLLYKK